MNLTVRQADSEGIHKAGAVPASMSEYNVPGSITNYFTSESGDCFIQEVKADGFDYAYCIFTINKACSFILSSASACCFLCISLEGEQSFKLKSFEDLTLKEGRIIIFWKTMAEFTVSFKKCQLYQCIYINYPLDFILQALKFFPLLDDLKQLLLNDREIIPGDEVIANAECMNLLYRLLHAPYAESIKSFHIKIMQELLQEVFKQASVLKKRKTRFSINDIEKVYLAKELIDGSLPKHFSIRYISRKAGLNEEQLKKGFKAIYGLGLYAYLKNEILNIAKAETEQTNKPIKTIAYRAGYKSPSNFSIAFKKKFNVTPSEQRRRSKKENKQQDEGGE